MLFHHDLAMALVLPNIKRRHTLTGLRSDTRFAIDTILNSTQSVASPLTSSTGATANVAECVMCVRESHGTGYKKAKVCANKANQSEVCVKCGRHTCKKHRSASVSASRATTKEAGS